MNSPAAPRRRWFRFSLRTLFVVVLAIAIPMGFICWLWRHTYPYGREHCCDTQLCVALMSYADGHGGRYPTGGATPEASLSLLYPNYADVSLLRGKAYSEEAAAKLLESGKPLTPETCGWHYVDGLKMLRGNSWPAGSRCIALFWDKIGLGHNSDRLPSGGHTVVFLDCSSHVINEADWPRFLADQEKAVAALRRGEKPDAPGFQSTWIHIEYPKTRPANSTEAGQYQLESGFLSRSPEAMKSGRRTVTLTALLMPWIVSEYRKWEARQWAIRMAPYLRSTQ